VRADRLLMLLGPLVVVVLIVWLAGFCGPDRPHAFAEALWVLFTSMPLALCWLLAAFGYGWPLRRWLLGEGSDWAAIDMGLGVAFMLVLDAGLGAMGILQQSGGLGAWVVVLVGFGLVIAQLRRVLRPSAMVPWPAWAAAPAIAVLLLAVCSAPGWIWATEFGGFDALSYHLQLPKEWLALDRITPLDHNVYSYLPGYVEAAYYHLAVLHGDAIASVYACQLLHAGFTLLTAAVVGRIAWRHGGRAVGAAAAAIVLGTPWTVVAGSLGYNDMAVAFLLATGLLVIQIAPPDSLRRGAAVGLLAAAACGAKLTAIGFVAVPLGLLMLAAVPPKRWPAPAVGAAIAAVLCLLPYLARNWVYSGNPVFPFATGLLGLGHWTQQQAEIWTSGHLPDLGLAGRFGEAWNQLARFGIGPNPDPTEPRRAQWSLLPWLAAGGLAAGLAIPALRSRSWRLGMVLAVQLVFWLAFTHIKSRFMLPAVVPAALALAIGLEAIAARTRSSIFVTVLAIATRTWCCLPVVILLGERNRMPAAMVGLSDVLTGDGLSENERLVIADAFPVVYVNHILAPETRTLLLGVVTPLYYRGRVAYQTTWHRGPLSEIMRGSDDPRQWMVGLREQGFTHVMVNPEMLELWEYEGWNDPLLTAPRVIEAAEQYADLEREFPAGLRLYRLR
jgi:4-amino-4-deoxy-L-arabinose transferase-like glycosyltransferase